MKTLFIAAVVCAAVALPTEDTKLGAGVAIKDATPIASLIARPQEFVGKTVRIDGVATAVCQEMGCWLAVAPEGQAGGATVRLKVEHDGGIVFPLSAKGKQVSAEGVFEQVSAKDAHGKDAAGEHAKKDIKAEAKYHIKATGAIIK